MTQLLCWALQLYYVVLLVHVIFSWVPRPPEPLLPVRNAVRAIVEPLATPLRRVIPPIRTGAVAFDLSIIVLFFATIILQRVVCSMA